MRITGVILAAWLVCGIVAAGIGNAYFSTKYPTCEGRQELAWNLGYGLLGGPMALLAAFFQSGFVERGWSLRPINAANCAAKA